MRKKGLTSEDVWAMFAETDRLIKELRASGKETDRKLEAVGRQVEETSRQMKDVFQRMDESNRRMDKLNANLGGISNSNGEFAEEYFYNSLERQKVFAGIHFDEISNTFGGMDTMPNGKKLEDEFDIVMINKKSLALIEIKYKAKEKYIEDLVARKLKNFKILFPKYKDFNIYLGLGSLSFDKKTIEKAKKYGVGLLRQVGETIEYKADWKVKAY